MFLKVSKFKQKFYVENGTYQKCSLVYLQYTDRKTYEVFVKRAMHTYRILKCKIHAKTTTSKCKEIKRK